MNKLDPCRIHGDRWDGVLNHEWQIDEPSEAELEQALLRLDAERYTMVAIVAGQENHLAIAGGRGRYVVCATLEDELWSLIVPATGLGTVRLNAGGQEGDFPAAQVVTLEEARAAGLVFLRTHKLDPGQRWERQ